MNNRKATKRALLTSVMALVMCVVMLVGTTFAWFTDTATANVNTIKAGNLNVELLMQNSEGKWVSAENETLDFLQMGENGEVKSNANILWEPGATYQLPTLTIKNNGNLALKYKINVSGAKDADNDPNLDSLKLLDVLEWTYEVDGVAYTLDSEKHLTAKGTADDSDTLVIKAHMKESANNDYQNMAIEGIAITVYATQDTVEYDSTTKDYDKDAAYAVYPAGVTTKDFPETISYPTYNGKTETAEAVAAYVDSEGNAKYAADIANAIKDGATTIYLKKGADVKAAIWGTNRTPDLTTDLTIYANGADFQYGNISMNMTAAGRAANLTLKVYDANNIYVWGGTPNDGVTQTVILENCHNEGSSAIDSASRMFYITGTTGTVNTTLRNCSITKAEAPVYMKNNGSVTLENCKFIECASAVKISHAATGNCDVTITNTTFDKCGCTTEMAPNGSAYLTDDSSSIKCKTKGTMTLTLDNVAITNVVGSNSIIIDGDTGYTGTTTVNATNVTVDGNAWSN